MKKCLHDLTLFDVVANPIWQFTNSNPEDELEIESVTRRVFSDLRGLIIASQVEFADGTKHWALHQNVSLAGQKVNEHFLSLTLEREGDWFSLARYHDVSIENYGPIHLAQFMHSSRANIFPIKYDLRQVLCSDSPLLVGYIPEIPVVPLTEEQIIRIAVLGTKVKE